MMRVKASREAWNSRFRISCLGWALKVTTVEFYEKRRNNWNDLWNEYFWHGVGVEFSSE